MDLTIRTKTRQDNVKKLTKNFEYLNQHGTRQTLANCNLEDKVYFTHEYLGKGDEVSMLG